MAAGICIEKINVVKTLEFILPLNRAMEKKRITVIRYISFSIVWVISQAGTISSFRFDSISNR